MAAALQRPTQVSSYAEIAALNAAYTDLEGRKGWRDYQSRIIRMREEVRRELYQGAMDQFGNDRAHEKRAVLFFLDRLLGFAPEVRKQFEQLDEKRREIEDKAKRKTGIHGDDAINTSSRGRYPV